MLKVFDELIWGDIPGLGELRQDLAEPFVEVSCAEWPQHQALSRLGGGDGGREGHHVAAPLQILEQGWVKERFLVQQHPTDW